MQIDDQVQAYLWDICEAAREISGFVRNVKFDEFEKNKVLRYAVERQLHVIGEIATHLSPRFCKKHPEIDWVKLSELRHFIAHQYGETLTKRFWLAATESVPEMLVPLEKLLTK